MQTAPLCSSSDVHPSGIRCLYALSTSYLVDPLHWYHSPCVSHTAVDRTHPTRNRDGLACRLQQSLPQTMYIRLVCLYRVSTSATVTVDGVHLYGSLLKSIHGKPDCRVKHSGGHTTVVSEIEVCRNYEPRQPNENRWTSESLGKTVPHARTHRKRPCGIAVYPYTYRYNRPWRGAAYG
jgi:hypothetical protein